MNEQSSNIPEVQFPVVYNPSEVIGIFADALAKRYADLFDLFAKYHNDIYAVTLWGIGDGWSWLRGGQPLLFDNNLNPKPCYYSVLKSLAKGQKELKK